MSEPAYHESVLTEEVLNYLDPRPGAVICDATVGHAGHTLRILSRLAPPDATQLGPEGLLVGFDRDPMMLEAARSRIEAAHVPRSRYRLVEANHEELPDLLPVVLAEAAAERAPADAEPIHAEAPALDGILFDLGPSNPQLLDPARGMSWTGDGALDMRMTPAPDNPTAAELVNEWPAAELARIFREHADERWAKRIAERIVEARARRPIRSGRELGEVIAAAIPRKAWPPKTHPATRCFLALRVEINREYETLERVLPAAFEWLRPGGRMVVITFHSGEDRRVKDFMRRMTTAPERPWPLPQGDAPAPARLLTRKPVEASAAEREANPRSRSAKLRALEKQRRETAD